MKRLLGIVLASLAAALLLALAPLAATASTCPTYPYTLTNGQTADANQVMANFNSVLTCVNGNIATSGVNSNITALLGLTTPLSVSQGGTGGTTQTTAQAGLGLGTAALLNTGTAGGTLPVLNGPAPTWSNGANFGGALSVTGAVFASAGGQFTTVLGQGWGIRLEADPTNSQALFQITNNAGSVQWSVLSVGGSGQPLVSSTGFSGVLTASNGSTAVTQTAGDTSTDIATDAFAATAATNAANTAVAAIPSATTSATGLTTLATGAQVVTGTDTTHAVTPASLTSAQSIAANGYLQDPGGLYEEWGQSGSITANSSTGGGVTFPHACASAVYSIVITPSQNMGTGGMALSYVLSVSTSGFTIFNSAPNAGAYYWQARCK